MAMVLAWASMLFSTNSAMAFSGLLCESAMIRIAFQSSPIRNLPLSDSFDLAVPIVAMVTRNSARAVLLKKTQQTNIFFAYAAAP
jgi:hypothetical protein